MARVFGLSQNNSKVVLNVYDLDEQQNATLYPLGLGFYHSGVQIGGKEYTFGGGSGIFYHEPKQAPGVKLRESIEIGEFKGTSSDIDRAIDELRSQFRGDDYHVLCKNCNSFSDALLQQLIGKEIPGYVNRMAFIGSFFTCLMPENMTSQDPTQQQQQPFSISGAGSGGGRFTGNGSGKGSAEATVNPVFFSAGGHRLGGESVATTQRVSSGTFATGSGSGAGKGASANDLVDRRERVRAAALARLQAQQGSGSQPQTQTQTQTQT